MLSHTRIMDTQVETNNVLRFSVLLWGKICWHPTCQLFTIDSKENLQVFLILVRKFVLHNIYKL